MKRMFPPINFLILFLVISCTAYSQESQSYKSDRSKIIKDNVLGISFPEIGKAEKVDSTGYRMVLPATDETSHASPVVTVSVSNRLFVDLPGSYGGRLYLDRYGARRLRRDIAYTDTTESGSVKFVRQYWTVYAGMGMWECVINCYSDESGRYYILSLSSDVTAGKPGEHVGGIRLTSRRLKSRLLSSLRDTSNVALQQFNKLVTSFQIER